MKKTADDLRIKDLKMFCHLCNVDNKTALTWSLETIKNCLKKAKQNTKEEIRQLNYRVEQLEIFEDLIVEER